MDQTSILHVTVSWIMKGLTSNGMDQTNILHVAVSWIMKGLSSNGMDQSNILHVAVSWIMKELTSNGVVWSSGSTLFVVLQKVPANKRKNAWDNGKMSDYGNRKDDEMKSFMQATKTTSADSSYDPHCICVSSRAIGWRHNFESVESTDQAISVVTPMMTSDLQISLSDNGFNIADTATSVEPIKTDILPPERAENIKMTGDNIDDSEGFVLVRRKRKNQRQRKRIHSNESDNTKKQDSINSCNPYFLLPDDETGRKMRRKKNRKGKKNACSSESGGSETKHTDTLNYHEHESTMPADRKSGKKKDRSRKAKRSTGKAKSKDSVSKSSCKVTLGRVESSQHVPFLRITRNPDNLISTKKRDTSRKAKRSTGKANSGDNLSKSDSAVTFGRVEKPFERVSLLRTPKIPTLPIVIGLMMICAVIPMSASLPVHLTEPHQIMSFYALTTPDCTYTSSRTRCPFEEKNRNILIAFCGFEGYCSLGSKPICVDTDDGLRFICASKEIFCPAGFERKAWVESNILEQVLVVCLRETFTSKRNNTNDLDDSGGILHTLLEDLEGPAGKDEKGIEQVTDSTALLMSDSHRTIALCAVIIGLVIALLLLGIAIRTL